MVKLKKWEKFDKWKMIITKQTVIFCTDVPQTACLRGFYSHNNTHTHTHCSNTEAEGCVLHTLDREYN